MRGQDFAFAADSYNKLTIASLAVLAHWPFPACFCPVKFCCYFKKSTVKRTILCVAAAYSFVLVAAKLAFF